MGRSVSYPSGAIVAFRKYDESFYCMDCELENEASRCSQCEADLNADGTDWDGELEFLVEDVRRFFPSFELCDEWLGDEDHALAENRFAYFGVSEYGGLVALWLVRKDFNTGYIDGASMSNLADRWLTQVGPSFLKTFGTLRKLGHMSNGEGVFQLID